MAKNWTEEDEQYIRDNFLGMTYSELAEHFGVSTKAMESKIRRLGLKKQELLAEAEGGSQQTEEEPAEAAVEQPPAPIESLQGLPRRKEVREETEEERKARLEAEREAAEDEKERREEIRQDKEFGQALRRLEAGVKKMMAGKHATAAKEFEAILEESPADLGLAARARQYLDACQEQLDSKAPKPKTADDHYLQGVLLLNDGDPAGALEAFARALDKEPGHERALYCQAAAHAQRGDVEAALEALRSAVEANEANRVYAKNDPDFVPLRVHKEFQELVAPREAEAG